MAVTGCITKCLEKNSNFCFFLILMALVLQGCVTVAESRTLKQTDIRISWLMTHYRDAAAFGKLTLGERERVNTAYAAYEPAFKAALQQAGGNYNTPTPENVKAVANELIQVISSIPDIPH
jgi:hypothetical protein